jgi:hypothetical protein
MKRVEQEFWDTLKVTKKWREKVVFEYRKKTHIDTFFGFRRGGYMVNNQVTNTPVQGTAFHCLLWSFCEIDDWIIANLVTIVIFFITVGYYKGKVDAILKDNENLHNKLDAYHRRLDTHGDDLVRLNTKSELAITAKEVDEKYLSKEMFRQFEKHIDGRFDSVETSLKQILNFIKKD